MLKIDLSRKRVERVKRVERYKKIVKYIAYFALGLFLVQVLWLTGKLVVGKIQYDGLRKRVDILQGSLNTRTTEIREFFAVRESLSWLQKLDKSRFRYKEYLGYIDSLLPKGALLTNVDFSGKDMIVFSARFTSIESYIRFETLLKDGAWKKDELPVLGLTQESSSRVDDGSYTVKMILKLKNG